MVQSGLGSSLGSSGEEVLSHPVTLKMLFYVKIVIKPLKIEAQAQNKGQKNSTGRLWACILNLFTLSLKCLV